MQISWFHLLPALALLLFPLDRALGEKVRVRTFDGIQKLEAASKRRPWWWLPVVWADPVRSFVGATLLTLAFVAQPKANGIARMLPLLLTCGTLFIAIWVQMRTKRESGALLAPIGFVVGVVCTLVSWKVSVPALVLGISSIVAFRNFSAFFFMTAIGVTLIGYLFMGKNLFMFATVGLCATPILVNLLTQGYLGFPSRR